MAMDFLKDYWMYIIKRKKWFLIPVITILLLAAFLLVGSAAGPTVSRLIYAMF